MAVADRAVILRAGLVYFAVVFAAGFLLGVVRVTFLVPRAGERVAELAEMPVMLAVIWCAARFTARRFALPRTSGVRLTVGGFALVMLLGAEVLFAVVAQDRRPAEYIASRDPVSGTVYLAMLAVFAAMPWFQVRAKRR